ARPPASDGWAPWTVGVEPALRRCSTCRGHLQARLEQAWPMGSPWPPVAAVLRASPRSRAEASPPPQAVWQSERPGMAATPAPRAWRPPAATARVPRARSREADRLRTWLGREAGWRPPGRRWACRAKRWEGRSRWGAARTLTFPVAAERERRQPEPDR